MSLVTSSWVIGTIVIIYILIKKKNNEIPVKPVIKNNPLVCYEDEDAVECFEDGTYINPGNILGK